MNRQEIERRLDALVRDNRVTIAITFPLVGVALLIAAAEGAIPQRIAFNPLLLLGAVLVMRLPLIGGLAPLVDRRALVGLAVLAGFTYGVELFGVHTGVLYGEFEYLIDLGPMLLGDVPLALPVFYFPILLNSYLLVALLADGRLDWWARLLAVLCVVVGMDLVLDPGAVALGFWGWETPGAYYGVPAQNYVGWVASGIVAVAVLTVSLDRDKLGRRLERCEYVLDDLISFGVLWGLVNLYFGNYVPVALAVALLLVLVRADRFDVAGLTGGQVSGPADD
ncbi:putative membrane protein [Natronoarchaeum philippinense]|uniref:Putative membrane protein n=1 Tax=Natronoarchaeum philippinense TaxID=558529 RepID=A0A285P8L3_NATPI|nr:bisanhydrobacterioruberin hydratase [Natronoarchaeum philippinense]SNZ18089.1 putative membrane protein [Natronoarchaeum philippinense]